MQRFLVLIAATLLLGPLASSGVAQEDAPRRLATRFASVANQFVEGSSPPVLAIDMAILFAREGARLEPDDPESWRFLRDVAVMAERVDLHKEALDNIIRLDPEDDVSLLRRINLALDEMQTVEQRVAACRRMIAPERRAEIGPAVASRLALDMAFQLRRAGDTEGFAAALAESVAIDPTNRTAAAIAAGFFRMNVDDPVAEAELLLTFMQADPASVTTQIALARLLLEHGAYVGAARLYGVAADNLLSGLRRQPPDDLLADLATARWATGEHDGALRIIQERQQLHNELVRVKVRREDPSLDPLERAQIHGDLSPTLAAARAVIEASRGSAAAPELLATALARYDALIDEIGPLPTPEDATEQARLRLQAAWIAVWLGDDPDRVRAYLDAVEADRPLVESERLKPRGWLALREGDLESALAQLESIDHPDAAASLGLAQVYLALGRRQDGARALLATARDQPGSLIGIWAANELATIVNVRVPLSPVSRSLEELVAQVPPTFDRFPQSPSLAVSFDVRLVESIVGPYDPVILHIEVTNNASFPLAIDTDGPLRPEVILQFPDVAMRPIVVRIDRRLRLEPRERLIVPVNLRRYRLGEILATNSLQGVFVSTRGIFNVISTPAGALIPGPLGGEASTPVLRINGFHIEASLIVEEANSSSDPTRPNHLTRLALLGQASSIRLPTDAPVELFKLVADARSAVARAYEALDPVSQAWFLTTVPTGHLLPEVRASVQRSDDRRVKMAYVMFHLAGLEDPVLQAAKVSEDESLRSLATGSADIYQRLIERQEAQKAMESGLQ